MDPDTQANSLTLNAQAAECRVNEIFFSLQGESIKVGLPTIFIRLTGCPLRCTYCDTAYAFHEGQKMTIDAIIQNMSLSPAANR